MNHALSLVNAFAASWADAVARACWQGGLGIALVWLVCRLWPKVPPVPRCWIWRLAHVKLLLGLLWLPPLALPLLPHPPAPPPLAPPASTAEVSLSDVPVGASAAALPPFPASAPSSPTPVQPPPSGPTLPTVQTWLLAAWLLGVLAGMGRVAAAWRRARILYGTSTPLADKTLGADAAELGCRLRLRRVPPLRVADGLASPVLLGWARPIILLPTFVLTDCARPDLRLMLAHEMTHLARRDLIWNALPLLARLLFFFHPLVWLAGHEWSLAQEVACDAQAVALTATSPSAYGRMLLGIATRRRGPAAFLFPTLAVAGSRHTLRRRLFAMQHIGTTSRPRLILAAALTALLALGVLLPWRVVAQSQPPLPVSPAPAQKEDSLLEKYPMDFALENAKLDAQLAEVQKHLFPTQLKTVQPRIDTINAEYAQEMQRVQLSEKSRADYIAGRSNRLTDAQIAEINQLKGHIREPDRIQDGIQQRRVIKGALQVRIAATQDADLKRGWRRQIRAIDRRQREEERHIRELAPSIARLRSKLAAFPADQQERVAMLRRYDFEILFGRMHALTQKRVNVFMLHYHYVTSQRRHAAKPSIRSQSDNDTAQPRVPVQISPVMAEALDKEIAQLEKQQADPLNAHPNGVTAKEAVIAFLKARRAGAAWAQASITSPEFSPGLKGQKLDNLRRLEQQAQQDKYIAEKYVFMLTTMLTVRESHHSRTLLQSQWSKQMKSTPNHASAVDSHDAYRIYTSPRHGAHRIRIFAYGATGQHIILDKLYHGRSETVTLPQVPGRTGDHLRILIYDNGMRITGRLP